MGVCIHHRLLDPLQKLSDGGIIFQIGTDNQRIHEKANQTFNFAAVPIGDGDPQTKIILLTVTVQ